MDNKTKLFIIKFVHSIIFFFMVACLVYILYCAVARRYDWTLLIALGAILIEGMALLLNRFRCPMTSLAERCGAERGAATDLFLPEWCSRHTFKVSTVIFIIELIWLAVGYFS
jgi:hypothetical protein